MTSGSERCSLAAATAGLNHTLVHLFCLDYRLALLPKPGWRPGLAKRSIFVMPSGYIFKTN